MGAHMLDYDLADDDMADGDDDAIPCWNCCEWMPEKDKHTRKEVGHVIVCDACYRALWAEEPDAQDLGFEKDRT